MKELEGTSKSRVKEKQKAKIRPNMIQRSESKAKKGNHYLDERVEGESLPKKKKKEMGKEIKRKILV